MTKKKSTEQLISEVDSLIIAINQETNVRPELLNRMGDHLASIRAVLEGGINTEIKSGMNLSRIIIDSWPLGNTLGNSIMRFEEDYIEGLK